LEYVDSDGDRVVLSSQADYEAMIETECQDNKAIKIYLTERNILSNSVIIDEKPVLPQEKKPEVIIKEETKELPKV